MNNSLNKVSIIMSVFNAEATIANSIESILNQTFEDFEFLILDDASSDSTLEILSKYSDLDKRIRLFKNKLNIGLTKSLNFLIDECNYKYIARQDADDISYKNRIMHQVDFLDNSIYKGCSTRAKIKNSQRILPGNSIYLPLRLVARFKNPVIHGTLMIDRETLIEHGKYDERFYYSQDYKLIYDLINKNVKFKILNKELYELNMENNISTNHKIEQAYFANLVKKLS